MGNCSWMLLSWQVALSPDTKIIAPFKFVIAKIAIWTFCAPTYHFSLRHCDVCLLIGTVLCARMWQGKVDEGEGCSRKSKWIVLSKVAMGRGKTLCWYLLQNSRRLAGLEEAALLESASPGCPSAFEQPEVVPTSGVHKRKHTEMTISTPAWHWFPEPLNTHCFRHPCKISVLACYSTLSHVTVPNFGLPVSKRLFLDHIASSC